MQGDIIKPEKLLAYVAAAMVTMRLISYIDFWVHSDSVRQKNKTKTYLMN